MATILLTWELGAGSGHLVRLLPIAQGLTELGHAVVAAVKDVPRARGILPPEMTLIQAPVIAAKPKIRFEPPVTFAHVLHNVGFDDAAHLAARCEAWRRIYAQVRADAVVFDHSPTALLASRGLPPRRVLIGSGFFCPPDRSPLPSLRPWLTTDPARLLADELNLLDRMNDALRRFAVPPLERVTQLYSEADDTILTTIAELDHYPDRQDACYRGAWTKVSGKPLQWPSGQGKRIFAYLKPCAGLPLLLTHLRDSKHPTVVSCDGIPLDVQHRFTGPSLRFENDRLDMAAVATECDLGVLNGNHGTTIALLMAGKPSFHVPITLEQAMLAEAVRKAGAGLAASGARPQELADRFNRIVREDAWTRGAARLRDEYSGLDAAAQQRAIVYRVGQLARG